MSGLILDYPNSLKEILPVMREQFRYLDAIYGELDFKKILFTKDTEHCFNCRDLYPDFRNAFETSEEQANNRQDIKESLNELKNLSLGLVDKMDRELYSKMHYDRFEILRNLPGCENRNFHRKIPKKLSEFLNP